MSRAKTRQRELELVRRRDRAILGAGSGTGALVVGRPTSAPGQTQTPVHAPTRPATR